MRWVCLMVIGWGWAQAAVLDCPGKGGDEQPAISYTLPVVPPVAAAESTFPAQTVARLERAMDTALSRTHARAISVSVRQGAAHWSSNRTGNGESPYPRYYWASVGKILTAALVIRQLEARDRGLETPVQQLMPAFPWPEVTVDHLLRHVSGLTSYNEDPEFRQHPTALQPDQALQRTLQRGLAFCPDAGWYYSNTGYQQLGVLLSHLSGEPYARYANAELKKVMGSTGLQVLLPDELPADVAPLQSASGAVIQPGWPQGAGALVGSSDDMLELWRAILQQRFWPQFPASRLFERMHPMFEPRLFYGRGVMRYDVPLGEGRVQTWLGHSGGTPGAYALVAWVPDQQIWVAVALAGEGSAEATAALLVRSIGSD